MTQLTRQKVLALSLHMTAGGPFIHHDPSSIDKQISPCSVPTTIYFISIYLKNLYPVYLLKL